MKVLGILFDMGSFESGARDGTLREGIDIGMLDCGFFDDWTLGLCVSCTILGSIVGKGDGFVDGKVEALLVGA